VAAEKMILGFISLAVLQVVLYGLHKIDLRRMTMELKDALAAIDAATTKIAANVEVQATALQTQANTIQTISDEMDALELALKNAGVPQELIDQANGLASKTQAASDAMDTQVTALQAQVPVLQAIAAKGATNPVPVPVPEPAPTAPTAENPS
jgi:uncharacterized phage infection (PIP) family protein YhgE